MDQALPWPVFTCQMAQLWSQWLIRLLGDQVVSGVLKNHHHRRWHCQERCKSELCRQQVRSDFTMSAMSTIYHDTQILAVYIPRSQHGAPLLEVQAHIIQS